jgi:predicted kinase
VGLPASGKSTWFAKQGIPALSSDHIRELLTEDETNQNIHSTVFATLRYLLRQRLALNRSITAIDATHLTPWERKPYIEIAMKHNCAIEAVFFNTPLEICKQRNSARSRVVPEAVLDKMSAKLVKPSKSEGFSSIRVIRA